MRLVLGWIALTSTCFAQDPARQAADSANAYAFETFQLFRQITDGNFCFSPYSSQRVAALLSEGGKADTANELFKLAHLPADVVERHKQALSLSAALKSSAGKGGLELDIANSLWAPQGVSFLPAYVKAAAEQFGAATYALPGGDTVQSAVAVNAWIRQRTRGRITNLAGPSMFTPMAVTVVNAVYLKARWASPFDLGKTKPRAFTLPNGGSQLLPTMLQLSAFQYAQNDTCQCLELPLGAGDAAMVILLPADAEAQKKMEEGFSPASWQALTHSLEDYSVNVMLPRFSFSTQLSMKSMWQFLGARSLFEQGRANLDEMVNLPGTFVRDVMHEASIDVNELGAEATAATVAAAEPFGPGPGATKRRPVSFIANRPFLWLIQHRPTRLILFMGRFAGQ